MFLPVFFNKMQVPIYSSEQKLSFLKQKTSKMYWKNFHIFKSFPMIKFDTLFIIA